MLLGDAAPRSLAAGAAWCLFDEAVLGQCAEMERGVGRRLAEGLAGLGGRDRPVSAEQLEEGDTHRVGKGAHLTGIREVALRSQGLVQRGKPLPSGVRIAEPRSATTASLVCFAGEVGDVQPGAAAMISGCMATPSQRLFRSIYFERTVVEPRTAYDRRGAPADRHRPLFDQHADHRQVAAEIDAACRRRLLLHHRPRRARAGPRRARPPGPPVLRPTRGGQGALSPWPAAGAAWRGWFPLEGELTSGAAGPEGRPLLRRGARPSTTRGCGPGAPSTDPTCSTRPVSPTWGRRCSAGCRRHDRARAPAAAGDRARPRARGQDWFTRDLTGEPTVLFRIFRYPPTEGTRGGASASTPTTGC